MTDDLQFGFKQNMGCSDAIFAVKSTVNYFVERGSCVYAATLDMKKAFESVNIFRCSVHCWMQAFHFQLLTSCAIGIQNCLLLYVGIVVCLYRSQSAVACVRVAHYHRHCSICTLMSSLYRLNHVIVAVIYVTCFGCFVYADDIIILAP